MTSRDETALYSLAASCRLQEDDPQPPRLNVGTHDDPRMVDHVEAWRDYYARTLVEKLGAEPERLDAVQRWAITRRVSAPPSVSGSDVFGADEWECALELCRRGLSIVREAGAEQDPFARRRLLAGLAHSLNVETLGPEAGDPSRLVEELDDIDDDERRGESS